MISKTCPICGKIFWSPEAKMQVSCSKSCAAILREKKHSENVDFKRKYSVKAFKLVAKDKKTLITKMESVEVRNKNLIEAVEEADKLGMSYGRYSAMIERMKQ